MTNSHTRRQANLRHPATCALICLLAFWNCESFQPVGSHRRGIKGFSPNNAIRTSMYAARKGKTASINGSMTKGAPVNKKGTSNKTKPAASSVNGKRQRKPLNKTPRTKKPNNSSSKYVMQYELLGHEILTTEEEKILGTKIRRAVELKTSMAQFLELKQQAFLEEKVEEQSFDDELADDLLLGIPPAFDIDDAGELKSLSLVYENKLEDHERRSLTGVGHWDIDRLTQTDYSIVDPSSDEFGSAEYDPNSLSFDELLTEEDVVEQLGVPGGRDELARILVDGALAKEQMISCNIRLVVSIAKKWCLRSNMGDANGGRSSLSLYSGSWSRPSLDEAVQEGVIGLTTAADRFEPERNLKFGTYATYWIQNSVRNCFNRAKEGGVRVPPYFHVYRQKYQQLVQEQYKDTGKSLPIEAAAEALDLTVKRLDFILQSTEVLISLNAGPRSGAQIPGQGGKAGGDVIGSEQSLALINNLRDKETPLEDQIEISLLRRCLENAMATELSPHERDVLRLRHGLDDGVSRTIREVAEICGGTISQSDVRTAEMRACRKLRSPYSVHTVQLYEFLDFVGGDLKTVKTTNKR